MADTTTGTYQLVKQEKGKQDWDAPLNSNFDKIDTGLACARTHFRRKGVPFAANLTIKPEAGIAQGWLKATDNITSMDINWDNFKNKNNSGTYYAYELLVKPSAGISITWPTNVVWVNGAAPRLNGTKVLRVLFEFIPTAPTVVGSFMGWEG